MTDEHVTFRIPQSLLIKKKGKERVEKSPSDKPDKNLMMVTLATVWAVERSHLQRLACLIFP